MTRYSFNQVHKRTRITIYTFSDESNQVVYTCVANNLMWAKELFSAQFQSGHIPSDRKFIVHKAELNGTHFSLEGSI